MATARFRLHYVFSMVLSANHLVLLQCDCSEAGFVDVIDCKPLQS